MDYGRKAGGERVARRKEPKTGVKDRHRGTQDGSRGKDASRILPRFPS